MSTPRFALNPNYKWYVIGMLWFMAFFNYADRQAFTAVVPLLRAEMNLTKEEIGLLGAAFAWVYGLGAPFAGLIVDKIKRKTAILGGLQVWSIICVATALSKNFRQLFFFRAAEGIGETFYFPAAMSLVSDYHGKKTRSRAMGLHQTSVYAGTILGSIIAAEIGQRFGWRYSFVFFGSLGILLGIVLHKLLHEPERGAADRADANISAEQYRRLSIGETALLILRTPTVFTLMLGFIFANTVALVLLIWMPTFIYDKFHLQSLAVASLMATVPVQVGSMLGAMTGGWLADSWRAKTTRGRIATQALGVLLAAPFVVLSGAAPTMLLLGIALAFWGFFKGIYDSNIFASVYDVVPAEARGTTAGLMNAVGWTGGAAGPYLLARIATASGDMSFAISVTSVIYILACLTLTAAAILFVQRDANRMQAIVRLTPNA